MNFSFLDYVQTFFQVGSLERISIEEDYDNVSKMLPPLDGKIFALNIKPQYLEKNRKVFNQGTNGSIEEYDGKNFFLY